MSKAKDLMRKGSFLVMISVFIKLIGFVYRIPMTNMIGDTGNGYYGVAYQIYSFFIILSTFGVSEALSRMISERLAKREYANARQVFWMGLMYAGGMGLLFCLVLILGGDFIASVLFNMPQSVAAVRSLAPAVLMVSISSVFRGLYQGIGDVRTSAYADLLDQVFHAGFSILLIWITISTSGDLNEVVLGEAAASAARGSMYGAMGGLLLLLFIFLIFRAKSTIFNAPAEQITERKLTLFKYFICLVIPIMIAASVSNLRELIDTALFKALMPLKGYEADMIDAQLGKMTGKYNVMINMPIAALGTLTIVSVPSITRSITQNNHKAIQEHIDTLMKLVLLVSMPAAVGLSILGVPIIEWLFPSSSDGGELLQVGAFMIIFFAVSQNASAILQGLGKIRLPVINALKSACISIPALILSILLLDIQVYSMILSVTLFGFFIAFFNMRSVLKYSGCKIDLPRLILPPAICSALMGAITWLIYHGVFALISSHTLSILLSVGISVVFYFVLLLNSSWYTPEEIRDLPYGRFLIRLRFKK